MWDVRKSNYWTAILSWLFNRPKIPSVSSKRYRGPLGFLPIPLQSYNNIIWQQDSAPPHAVREMVVYLNGRYNEWIGRNETLHWPPNSPDITPMDTFLWGHLKRSLSTAQ